MSRFIVADVLFIAIELNENEISPIELKRSFILLSRSWCELKMLWQHGRKNNNNQSLARMGPINGAPCVCSHHFEIVTKSTLRLSYIFVFIQPKWLGNRIKKCRSEASQTERTCAGKRREKNEPWSSVTYLIYLLNIQSLWCTDVGECERLCWPHRKEKVTICYKSSSPASRVRLQPHSYTTAFSYGGLATFIHSHSHNLMLHNKHKSNSIFMFY